MSRLPILALSLLAALALPGCESTGDRVEARVGGEIGMRFQSQSTRGIHPTR